MAQTDMAQTNEISSQPSVDNAAAQRWVLKYGDRVYGPYSFETMKTYVAEGRVAEHSLLAPEGTPAGAGMWRYAIDLPLFAELLRNLSQPEAEPDADASVDPEALQPQSPAEAAHETAVRAEDTDLTERDEADPVAAADEPGQQDRPFAEPASITQPADERRVYGPAKGQVDRRKQPETANFLIIMDIKARFAGPLEQAIMSLGPAYKLAANVWCVNTDATAPGLLNDLSPYIGRSDSMFIADTTRDRTAWSSMGPEVDAKIRRVWRRTY
ncbi:hypothetical protein Plav_2639 [Parvibaculum lavamentivorans DS-1]|uniref:GYF domain-containing protein n=1 Tax=Parvibaculum lavamentivorans (strain DS-1 / DSM 13023 / NCIMB 13966) TaxID=402881 RepID=A7HWG4_PARL1|nr:hypothetical protein [Parvibaculum lavamentivorans]ABS64247.1 hypothetical protein Plav_2639 [Parvibaculum lavamentivorans DS-1]